MAVVINGSAGVTTNSGAVYNGISAGTAVASTSGTSIDFTSIPSWVKRITVELAGVSLSGSANLLLQLGAGSVTSSGYISTGGSTANGGTPAIGTSTSGFYQRVANAAYVLHGAIIFTLVSSNQWVASGNYVTSGTATICTSGGSLTLAGTLDRVRITTDNGTDTFDAGSINILYE